MDTLNYFGVWAHIWGSPPPKSPAPRLRRGNNLRNATEYVFPRGRLRRGNHLRNTPNSISRVCASLASAIYTISDELYLDEWRYNLFYTRRITYFYVFRRWFPRRRRGAGVPRQARRAQYEEAPTATTMYGACNAPENYTYANASIILVYNSVYRGTKGGVVGEP